MAPLTNMLKALCFTALICLVVSLDLNFEEDGGNYTEKISINNTANTIEYDVPQHGRVGASKYLIDYVLGYNVMKVDDDEKCYVMDIKKDEPSPRQVKLALLVMNGTFPKTYFVEKNNIFPVYQMDVSQLSQAILTFCGNYRIMKSISAKSIKAIEQTAINMLRKKQRQRRSLPSGGHDYTSCTPPDMSQYTNCLTSLERMAFQCKIVPINKCIYKAQCKPLPTAGGWNCNGKHVFTGIICCDLVCLD